MEPQRLAANRGWAWIKQGYALFMKAPLLWVVVVLICFFAAAGLSAVPVVGEPLASLLLPVVLAGLMAGCRALERGEELELAHLFSGFQQRTSQLVTLGGIALVGQFLIFGVMMMAGGAGHGLPDDFRVFDRLAAHQDADQRGAACHHHYAENQELPDQRDAAQCDEL